MSYMRLDTGFRSGLEKQAQARMAEVFDHGLNVSRKDTVDKRKDRWAVAAVGPELMNAFVSSLGLALF